MAPGAGILNRIGDLDIYLVPFYSKQLPERDGWNGILHYQSGAIGDNQSNYSIISYGKDRSSTGIDVINSNYLITSMEGFENDICFSNGVFTYAPKIK
jgi:hypothetical protein